MKYGLGVFVLGIVFWGVSIAQSGNPEWFVLDSRNELISDEASIVEGKVVTPKNEPTLMEQGVSEDIFFDEVAEDNVRFAKNNKDLEIASQWLKREFKNEQTKNILLSPLDFYLSSVLLANGVVDQTLFEFSKMFSVMRLSEVNQQLKSYLLRRSGSTSLKISLWGKVFSEHFSNLMKKQLDIEIWGLNDNTEIINDWVKAKTGGKISRIIPLENVAEKDMFLVSSACFESFWRQPFDPSVVEQKEFYNLNGQVTKIEMLQNEQAADYYENEEMYALRLFFETGDYISLFMPKKTNNFEEFVEEFSVEQLKPAFQKRLVSITLPKVEIEYQSSIIKDLYKMFGVKKVFEKENYEFAKMVNFDTEASIKDVLLKAKMKIDEGVSPNNIKNKEKIIPNNLETAVFNANRPFLFIINNGDFIGMVVKAD